MVCVWVCVCGREGGRKEGRKEGGKGREIIKEKEKGFSIGKWNLMPNELSLKHNGKKNILKASRVVVVVVDWEEAEEEELEEEEEEEEEDTSQVELVLMRLELEDTSVRLYPSGVYR